MGIGQALSEGTQLDDDGRQRNPHLLDYKLVTAADAPQIDIAWVEIDTPNAGPKGSKGVGEPPCVPTAGAVANAIAKATGARVRAADDARARLGGDAGRDDGRDRGRRTSPRASVERRSRLLARRRAPRRRRHGPRRRRAPGQGAAARGDRRDPPARRAARHRVADGGLRLGALATHDAISRHATRVRAGWTALADASAIVGSHATRNTGTIGGNVMNASPAMETGGPLLCFGATVVLRSARAANADRRGRRPLRRPRPDHRGPRRAPGRGRRAGARAGHGQLLRPARVPPPDGDRGRRRDRRRHARRRRVVRARVAITALAPTIRRVPRPRPALVGTDGGRRGGRARPPAAAAGRPAPDRRRPRLRRLPPRDGGRDRAARDRGRARPRPGRDVPIPAGAARPVRRGDEGRRHARGQRRRLPGRDRAGPQPALGASQRARPDRHQGGLRRLRVRRLHGARSTAGR